MQLARNPSLWPGGGFVRKGLEAATPRAIDVAWPKRLQIAVYFNIVEWAPGVYGAEAAARHHFRKPASQLTRRESTLLAAVLPGPRHWSAGQPGPPCSKPRRHHPDAGRSTGPAAGLLGMISTRPIA
jgi:monofunctional biosynthetic peptidoglycan transglycosylase